MVTHRDRWTAAILTGGRARRLGGESKSDLVVGRMTIRARLTDALERAGCRWFLVGRPIEDAQVTVDTVADRIVGVGPLGGIHAALLAADADRVLVLAGDLPFVTSSFLVHVMQKAPDAAIVVPRTERGLHPLCGVYARACVPTIEYVVGSGGRSVHALFDRVPPVEIPAHEVATFDPDGMLLFNVNTPDEHREACMYAERAVSATMLSHGSEAVKRS